jgi:deazaflavin-dependent oxidoreductase (nitroreductase family)
MFPRKGSAIYSLIKSRGENQKRVFKRWKLINRVVVLFYHLGVLALLAGDFILLLFTEGRSTGKTRINPLEYRTKEGVIHIFSARGKKSDWFKNMMKNPESVLVKVRFKSFKPLITVIKNIDDKEEILRWYIRKYSRAAKFLFGWVQSIDDPQKTDITSSILELIQIIQLREQDTRAQ